MTQKEYFDTDGHLTDFALTELISGEPNELTRLELAEHLSFCDACTDRYTTQLCPEILLEPEQALSPGVIQRIRQRARVIFFNRYLSAGIAACLAMVLWVTGAFSGSIIRADSDGYVLHSITGFSTAFSEKAGQLGQQFTDEINNFFHQYDLRGAFQNEKK